MDLIHYVVKDGVLNGNETSLHTQREELENENDRGTAYACMRHLQKLLEHSKVSMGEFIAKFVVNDGLSYVFRSFTV